MKKVERWLHGLVRKETELFVSKKFDELELIETVYLFGFWKVSEEVREVYIPPLTIIEESGVAVIRDAFLELYTIAETIKTITEKELVE